MKVGEVEDEGVKAIGEALGVNKAIKCTKTCPDYIFYHSLSP